MENMDETVIEQMEGLIVKAIQAGKKETSGLVADLKNQLITVIRSEIQITVNGKIDGVKEHLKNQDTLLQEIRSEQKIVKDNLIMTDRSLSRSQIQFWTAMAMLLFLGGTIIYLGRSVLYNNIDIKIKESTNKIAEEVVSALEEKYDLQILTPE